MTKLGSFHNNYYAGGKNPIPEIGMGATILMWTDRHACTIVDVKGKSVFIREDIAKRTDGLGMSDCQTYEYTPNPDAPVQEYTLRKNGKYIKKGNDMKNGTVLAIGFRREYYDFSF
jgi:hypothetical protein